MRYADVMENTETAVPGGNVVLFASAKESSIIGAALAEYAERHKRNRTARNLSKWFDHNIMVE